MTAKKASLAVVVAAILLLSSAAAGLQLISSEDRNEMLSADAVIEPYMIGVSPEEIGYVIDALTLAGIPQSDVDAALAGWEDAGYIGIQPMWANASFIAGIAVGIFMSHKFGGIGGGGAPVGNTPHVMEELRLRLVHEMHTAYNVALAMFWQQLAINTNILQFTQLYWNLQVDAVVNSLFAPNTPMGEIDRILQYAGITDNFAIIKHNVNRSLNQMSFQNQTPDWAVNGWAGTDPATYGTPSDPKVAIGWQFDNVEWVTDSTSVYMMLGDYVFATAANNRVYIDIETDPALLINLPNVNAMYITNTAPVTIRNVDTQQIFTLQPGVMNDLFALGLTSGFYDLSPNCGYISPNLLPSLAPNGITPTTGFVLNNGPAFAMGFKVHDGYRILHAGQILDVDDVYFIAKYQTASGNWVTLKSMSGDMSMMTGALDTYTHLWNTVDNIYLSARNAAQLTWSVLDALEMQQGSYVIRPSAIISGLNPNLNLPMAVQTALVVALIGQLIEQGPNADPSTLMISRESLEETVYVYGNVYFQGILIAENAVFTPVIYASTDAIIRLGSQTLDVRGNALLIVYAVDVPHIGAFVPNPTHFMILDLTGNVTEIDVFEIWVNGSQQSSFTLEVLSAQSLGYFDFGFTHRPVLGVQQHESNADMWFGLAILFAGLTLVMTGLRSKPVVPFIILGTIVMILGVLQISFSTVSVIIDLVQGFISFIQDILSFRWWPFW